MVLRFEDRYSLMIDWLIDCSMQFVEVGSIRLQSYHNQILHRSYMVQRFFMKFWYRLAQPHTTMYITRRQLFVNCCLFSSVKRYVVSFISLKPSSMFFLKSLNVAMASLMSRYYRWILSICYRFGYPEARTSRSSLERTQSLCVPQPTVDFERYATLDKSSVAPRYHWLLDRSHSNPDDDIPRTAMARLNADGTPKPILKK